MIPIAPDQSITLNPPDARRPGLLTSATALGAVLLLLACSAYGVLEVHSSTDTWISLAAGKQIDDEWAAGRGVPTRDTFSYTMHGQPWYNQNWLAHWLTYWLYDRIGPDAVIWGTWLLNCSAFLLVLLACYWRSGALIGSTVASALVAFGSRDFVSARPATLGFWCLAALWALLCAIEGQGARRRWWPIAALVPLLVFFGMVHGSFVFAYGLLGLYAAHGLLMRLIAPRWTVASRGQLAGICVAVGLALALTIAFGPFGIGNFIHPQKIAGSGVFRTVQEWIPPFLYSKPGLPPVYPPAERFWVLLGASAFGMLLAGQFALFAQKREPTSPLPPARHWSLFDIAALLLGLGMALFARRFIPMYYIFAAPLVVLLYQAALPRIPAALSQKVRVGFAVSVWCGAALIGLAAAALGYQQIVADRASTPHLNLFERVTRYDREPDLGLQYLIRNPVPMNALVEWGQAGSVMFRAPHVKVYTDGRAQQVYNEELYVNYVHLLINKNTQPGTLARLLDAAPRTDAALLRRGVDYTGNLWKFLERDPAWALVLVCSDSALFVRRDSAAFRSILERLARGEEWRPDGPEPLATRGMLWTLLPTPDFERALADWQAVVERDAGRGLALYRSIGAAYLKLGRADEAIQYFEAQLQRVGRLESLEPTQRSDLGRTIQGILRQVRQRPDGAQSRPTPEP